MKGFLDHSFRYTVFFLSAYLPYAVVTGFGTSESGPPIQTARTMLMSAVLGMAAAGVAKLISRSVHFESANGVYNIADEIHGISLTSPGTSRSRVFLAKLHRIALPAFRRSSRSISPGSQIQ